MRFALARFADYLRRSGFRVSPAEIIEAGRALGEADLADREEVRDTLRVTLAKSRSEWERVEELFDRFFAPPRLPRKKRGKGKGPKGGEGEREGLPSKGGKGRGGLRLLPLRKLGLRPPEGAAARPEAKPARREEKKPAPPAGEKSLRRLGEEFLSLRRARLEELAGRARRPEGASIRTPILLPPRQRRAGRAAREGVPSPPPPIARKSFRGTWSPSEEDALLAEVARALSLLRLRRSRRLKAARRGPLWVQRIFRQNLGHDGVPFALPRRGRRRREPHLLLLVDLSHSVARAAAAFLSLATHLARPFRGMRVYFFVDRPVEATRLLERLARAPVRAEALERLAAGLPELNLLALSDYGRVFFDVLGREKRRARKDTLLLILGDGRTNRFDPCPWALEELRGMVRRAVWLAPEPRGEWGKGDSALPSYAPHCDLLCEAADLEGLLWALGRGLRRTSP